LFRIGSAFSSACPMLAPICLEVTSTSGDSPVTVTFSSRPPTTILMSSDVVLPIVSCTSACSYFLKPVSSAVTR